MRDVMCVWCCLCHCVHWYAYVFVKWSYVLCKWMVNCFGFAICNDRAYLTLFIFFFVVNRQSLNCHCILCNEYDIYRHCMYCILTKHLLVWFYSSGGQLFTYSRFARKTFFKHTFHNFHNFFKKSLFSFFCLHVKLAQNGSNICTRVLAMLGQVLIAFIWVEIIWRLHHYLMIQSVK